MRFQKSLFVSLTVVAAAVLAGGYMSDFDVAKLVDKNPPTSAKTPSPAKPGSTARVVFPQPLENATTLTLSGRTAPIEQAAITSRANGIVAERKVDIGDRVKVGQVLLSVDAPEITQELARAQAAIVQARARLELAELNEQRANALVTKGFTSEQQRDERQINKRSAAADLLSAEAEVKRLSEIKGFQTIRAPFDGTIVSRGIERGDRVVANEMAQGVGLFRIARLNELRIELDIPQSSALRVKEGADAKVVFAELPDQAYRARVVRVSGFIDPASATMRAELVMPNPGERIPAGLIGQVMLTFPPGDEVVTVPNNTLVIRSGQQRIAVVDTDDKVRFRTISVGRDFGERVEIVAGLKVTDRVVLSPNALLRDGDTVEVTVATAAGKPAMQTK